ncbi:flagellar hook-length control protein [Salmonella enterica subsp. enterica serovar Typhimurium]|nr:flagellar hook-length control protein [Salmonella enterica subsp. enterica serovar Typhimurium]
MITLPQLITTDTDMTAGLTSGKTTVQPRTFWRSWRRVRRRRRTGQRRPHHAADLQAAGGKLSKELTDPTWRAGPGGEACRPAGAKSECDG